MEMEFKKKPEDRDRLRVPTAFRIIVPVKSRMQSPTKSFFLL